MATKSTTNLAVGNIASMTHLILTVYGIILKIGRRYS